MKANLDKNLAPAWVSGKSYSTGEFCLYNKRLYICTTDNSDAEFDNSKWERRNLVDLVSGINSNLSEVVLESTSYRFNTSVVEFYFNVDKHNTISYHLNGTTYGNYSITGYKKDGSSEVIYKSAQDVNVTGDYEYDVTLYTKVKINTTGNVNISNVLIK